MSYRSSDKTRQKKDAKRTNMMQSALRVFATKGYHAATIRDIVKEAHVAIGTFYFYFPDKETLFIHLYEETADFLLQALTQALNSRTQLPLKIGAAVQAYINIALYEPAIVQLLLVGGIGAIPALEERRLKFRQKLIHLWLRPLEEAAESGTVLPQNSQITAQGISGAIDEMILNFLNQSEPELIAKETSTHMAAFLLRASGYTGS